MATLYPEQLIESLTEEQQIKLAEIALMMERIAVLVEEPDLGGFFAYKLQQLARGSSMYEVAEKYWRAKAWEEMNKHSELFQKYETLQQQMEAQQRSIAQQQSLSGLTRNTYSSASDTSSLYADAIKILSGK